MVLGGFAVFAMTGAYLPLICFLQDSSAQDFTGYSGPIIDAHAHLLPLDFGLANPSFYIDSLVKAMDKMGVTKAILSTIENNYGKRQDQVVLEASRQYPDRLYPFLKGFDPSREEFLSKIDKEVAQKIAYQNMEKILGLKEK